MNRNNKRILKQVKMKKYVCTVLAALAMFGAYAQPTEKENTKEEEVEIEIDGNKVTIETDDLERLKGLDLNKILADVYKRSAEVEKQRALAMERIERQLAAGEISQEEAEELQEQANERAEESMEVMEDAMEDWGEAYEDQWEAWAEQLEARMEEWETQVESRGAAGVGDLPPMPPLPPLPGAPMGLDTNDDRTVIINDEGIIIRRKEGGEEPFALRFDDKNDEEKDIFRLDEDNDDDDDEPKSIDRTDGYLDLHFGFNQQLRGGNALIAETSADALSFWKSTSFNIGTGWKTRLGNPYSKFYFKYGIDFSFHNFRLLDNNIIAEDPTDQTTVFIEGGQENSYEKSKYFISYFNVPLMFQLDFSEVGEQDEAFTLGLGGYGGVRMQSKRELEYSNAAVRAVEEKTFDTFNTSRLRYGVMAQVGWDSFKITGSYDFNTFFEENRGPSYNMLNITLGLTI
jgi:hypothetical protein